MNRKYLFTPPDRKKIKSLAKQAGKVAAEAKTMKDNDPRLPQLLIDTMQIQLNAMKILAKYM